MDGSVVGQLSDACGDYRLRRTEFQTRAWNLIGRKVNKRALLAEIYAAAQRSIGVPVALDSAAIAMFRLMLEEFLTLDQLRERIAEQAAICWRTIQTAAV